jgi:soluble lytic murein transglycosylase
MIFSLDAIAGQLILPSPKPSVDQETKKKVAEGKEIYPEKKPLKKKIVKNVSTTENKTENDNVVVNNNVVLSEAFVYPEKKPIIVKPRIDKIVKESSVVSKRDFKIAKSSFEAISKKKWQSALKLSRKAKDKSIYNLINYLYLIRPSNAASFYDYVTFINSNPNYPRINRLKYLAEHKINLNTSTHISILTWLQGNEPLSDFGRIKLGEIYLKKGNIEKGSKLIKEGWVQAKLNKNQLKFLRKKYKKIITIEDNIKRADWHAWEAKHWDVQRMLKYLPKDYTALYRARQLLMSKSYGVDTAIKNVPSKFKNDIGLKYDRLKWRRRRGRIDPSLEILFNIPNDPDKLIRPDIWWKERAILARSLIYKKKYALAYKVSSNHSLKEGPNYAAAEWLSGWIALTFLNDPNMALQHFKSFYNNVGYPISLSRGAFWIARTYKELKNKQKSDEWFKEASKYLNTYYGQLAFIEIYPEDSFSLPIKTQIDPKFKKKFLKNTLVKNVLLLKELDKTKHTKDLLKHLAMMDTNEGSEILAGNLAIEIGRYDFAIQIAKAASYEKRFYNKINYPIIETPKIVNKKTMPNSELILAVIRQESEFDQKANSYVGARGMMQVMTYTAKLVAKQAKMKYSKNKLTTDPGYNIQLGSYYLAGLLEEYEGSYPFALAAYNAGPKRVKYWKKINGNPQKGKISYIDWIELIKFKETRNYVQRVLENINVYRFMLNEKPIRIDNFFENKKLY